MLALIMTILAIATIASGFLFGFTKGLKKSILRFIIVIGVVVVCVIFRETFTKWVLAIQFSEGTLEDKIIEILAKDSAEYKDYIYPIFKSLISIFVFLCSFVIFLTLSQIIYLILKTIFCGENGKPKKKKRLSGALVGLLQGTLVAFVLYVPAHGVISSFGKVLHLVEEVEELDKGNSLEEDNNLIQNIQDYNDSPIAGIYTATGSWFYNYVSAVKTEDGKKITLDGQISALESFVIIVKEYSTKVDLDFSEGLTDENVQIINEFFTNLENVQKGLNQESLEALDAFLDGTSIQFSKINFEQEAEVLDTLKECQDHNGVENTKKMVENLGNSNLILNVFVDASIVIPVSNTEKSEINEELANSTFDEKTKKNIQKIFGIS